MKGISAQREVKECRERGIITQTTERKKQMICSITWTQWGEGGSERERLIVEDKSTVKLYGT